jgi:hypothetical protein
MNVSRFASGLAAVSVALCLAAPALAAGHKNVLPEPARTVEGGRTVQVLLAQGEIKSDINPSNIAAAAGGGLMMALIDAKVNSDRAKKAEIEIQPLRAALTGYDVDALALDTTKAATADIPWFQTQTVAFGRDSSVPGKSAVLSASPTGELAFFEYTYDTSPDASAVRVVVNIQLAEKALADGAKPESRLANKALAYAGSITSIVLLPNPSKAAPDNYARWSANDGQLARKALAAAFGSIRTLIPRALQLSEDDLKTMSTKDKKNVVRGGFAGRLQEDGPDGALLYNGGLLYVQTLHE